ncbi:hypothetical protein AJ79_00197 [Helicocarpus griseus UAMH5409]|uniref:Uncharacterized protein n=1 Tax=Helicocarpus griseus UAMH5409 TaxID=1447875 RepID=A0A2B7Y3U8_9EURO|nr:hypothetical protein AJ79_00197 [Helicocarpus griseus UAMH5409]
MPVAADMLNDAAELPEQTAMEYIPSDLPQLAEYWVMLIRLSKLLGDVLLLSYRPSGPLPTLQQVEALEAEIMLSRIPDIYRPHQSRLGTFYQYHLQLHYQAVLITFYRPFITRTPENLEAEHQEAWQIQVRNKIDVAALNTNGILDIITRENLLQFAGPMTPPLLVPAMHIHLLKCKSPNVLSRSLGLNKLEFCMMVMAELQNTHTSPAVYRGIFLEAIRQLFPDYKVQTSIPDFNPSELSVPYEAAAEGPSENLMVTDDIVNALMDEVSLVNFWESLSQM